MKVLYTMVLEEGDKVKHGGQKTTFPFKMQPALQIN